jgi:hypothetical protein
LGGVTRRVYEVDPLVSPLRPADERGVGAAFLGAGPGATDVAWKAASAALVACLGGDFGARLDDKSHCEE